MGLNQSRKFSNAKRPPRSQKAYEKGACYFLCLDIKSNLRSMNLAWNANIIFNILNECRRDFATSQFTLDEVAEGFFFA